MIFGSIWRWISRYEPEVSVRLESSEPVDIPNFIHTVYAHRGEQIICENGHPIAQVTRDIKRGDMQGEHDLYFNGETAKPAMGTPAEQCRCYLCDGLYFKGDGHFHFKDGWR